MKHALENAIFYTNHYSSNTILTINYKNKNEIYDIIKNFRHNINVREIFGSHNNVCYDICDNIMYYYDVLLLEQVSEFLIVTRKGNSIRFLNSEKNTNKKIAIINLDSVLAELNINKQYSIDWTKWMLLGIIGYSFYYHWEK